MKLRTIVNLVEKIEELTDADIKKVNNFLKGDESDLRITKTEISQMKVMGLDLDLVDDQMMVAEGASVEVL